MEQKFLIKGGKPLRGEVEIRGAKNAAFPVLAAALLTKEDCLIENVPLIEDVSKMISIIRALGANVSQESENSFKINCKDIDPQKMPWDQVSRFRGSILILGPLLARFGKLKLPPPGGCLIGARPIDTHLDALSQLGVKICSKGNFYYFEKPEKFSSPYKEATGDKSSGLEVILREFSVTATENMLLFSAFSKDKILIKIADQDYQVKELSSVLRKMGAKVEEKGPHLLEVEGGGELKGFRHRLISDPIETGTFIVAALATRGEVLLKNAELFFLDLFLKRLWDFGAQFKIVGRNSIKVLPSLKIRMDKIQSMPWPGMHSDLQPELGVLATQAKGPTLIHDPLFEGRLKYLEELNKMGADIIFCDPHRAIVNGPTPLYGIEIPSLDLRAGAALLIAGLVAKGQTTLNNIYQIDRGYERIEERLKSLGADISRVESQPQK